MTSYADLVNAEAEAAESEDDDAAETEETAETEDEQQVEAEPEAQATIGPDEIRKAERAIEAQRRKLAGILGDDAVTHECLLCSGLGFMAEFPPLGTKLVFTHDEGDPLLAIEPPDVPPEFKLATDKEACPDCDGYGQVVTGAKTEHGRLSSCTRCGGNGWIGKIAAPTTIYVPPPAVPSAAPPLNPPEANVGNDAWGRPQGHPHWGVPPASVGA